MAKRETVHDLVFNVYHLTSATKETKEKVRKYINRQLNNEYPEKNWNDLSCVEKDTFLYLSIRQKMLCKYVDESFRTKVNARIDKHLKETLLNSDSDLKAHNSAVYAIYENYFDPNDDETTKMEKYRLLCMAIHNFNSHVPKPSFEEWCDHPLRPYDYIADFENEILKKDDDIIYPLQADIDHVILQILLKNFTAQTENIIDIDKIRECLTYIMNFEIHIDNYDTLLDEYDPNIDLSKEEQEEFIKANRKYYAYKKMLEELSFTKKNQ